MESWRMVWREGVVPLLKYQHLRVLEDALENDSPELLQGATTTPPPLQCVRDWPCEAACPLSYMGWKAGDDKQKELLTVDEVESAFAKMCFEIDHRLGEPAGCRFFLNWVDETDRTEMRRELLTEVKLSLKQLIGVLSPDNEATTQ